mmetsp:Transcript_21824/g.50348  ORF Transcript_21824/g.50348 Transcript_21824/m.50348 type:complete len:189 (+) Transcript_21824:93-659(+)|eukprot:CAMPEP_0116848092 /NCGR_PEP_ID=MMETSP0418-20121206/14800_1 /TAXON_ID=1158023 /ORGANISM="Astrosyne radiata, Strain 13vi08-1A" /LENGTH=188 /DNA_ID=CAMNT_0004479615 /DNA_START=44 /DNA_END=610 /DNA_ORIENTATION=+
MYKVLCLFLLLLVASEAARGSRSARRELRAEKGGDKRSKGGDGRRRPDLAFSLLDTGLIVQDSVKDEDSPGRRSIAYDDKLYAEGDYFGQPIGIKSFIFTQLQDMEFGGPWSGEASVFLEEGSIRFENTFIFTTEEPQFFAVVGGTGIYSGVGGQAVAHFNLVRDPDCTDYAENACMVVGIDVEIYFR